MKVIFMGTPHFAVPSLDILYNAGYDIAAVVTSVDKLGGRGRKTLIQSAVKQYALEKGLKVLQPKNLKSPKFNEELKALEADVQIVVAFRMLPEMVWNMPPKGTYNLHGSLLPAYRGAAPINWAIINGDAKTGVTTFKLKHEIDTGAIFLQKEIQIYPFDNAGDVHDRMMWVGADAILETVKAIEADTILLDEQKNSAVTHAPKLTRENTKIDFSQKCQKIYDQIRGLSPYPSAWFELDGKSTKVFKSSFTIYDHEHKAGRVFTDNKSRITITAADGYIDLLELRMSGKKLMTSSELLNGYNLEGLPIESL